jgi:hypothetical protein
VNGILSDVYPVVGKLVAYRHGGSTFDTPNVKGLVEIVGDRIDIIAIVASPAGHGHGARFIASLMQSYKHVRFIEVLNDDLRAMLERRGFVGFGDHDARGCTCVGFEWRA